jgi:inosose dehydratase
LAASLHPHTGTAVETRHDIDTIMRETDPNFVGFAPDTARLPRVAPTSMRCLETYLPRITHVHLKDWNGHYELGEDGKEIDLSGYANYEPIGNGILDMPRILDIIERSPHDLWVNVELDGTSRAPPLTIRCRPHEP